MPTVREVRIKAAMDAIGQQIEYGLLEIPPKLGPMRARACIELTAEAVVDALFPDHTFDNVETDPPFQG